jgi:hypothetical protein
MLTANMLVRCPVYLRYAKSRKRFIPCGQRMQDDALPRHMHNEHGIDSRRVLKFYQERSSDEDWWREHR